MSDCDEPGIPATCHCRAGATGGIGTAVSRLLTAGGYRLLIAGHTPEKLVALAQELDAPYYELDATKIAAVEACLTHGHDQLGGLHGVVNCVGSVLLKPAHLTSEDEWSQTIALNLTSAFATVRAAAKTMRDGGSVVLMSSAAARLGLANHEAIAAAKAGVIGLAQSAAASYAARGLRFNAVAPGLVKTPMTERIWSNPKSAEASIAMHALGRLGEPEDVASLIAWLLDPKNDWVTGEVFSIDGGLSRVRTMGRLKR